MLRHLNVKFNHVGSSLYRFEYGCSCALWSYSRCPAMRNYQYRYMAHHFLARGGPLRTTNLTLSPREAPRTLAALALRIANSANPEEPTIPTTSFGRPAAYDDTTRAV